MKEIILPGFIDVHTHCRQPGATQKEDFATATQAAVAGGFTTILDMPNNPIPTLSPQALRGKMDLARGSIYCDLGFNFGSNRKSTPYFEDVRDHVFAYKLYMNQTTGDLLVDKPGDQEEVFKRCPPEKIIMIHGEGDTLARAIGMSITFRRRIHVCHVSLKEEVDMIRDAREYGALITAEVTPHHLFLIRSGEQALKAYGKMRPPLATQQDQDALWKGIDDGVIDMIASDHAPHTKEEKESDNPPSGIPGLATTLPLMLTAVDQGRLDMDQLIDLLNVNPGRIFGISPTILNGAIIETRKVNLLLIMPAYLLNADGLFLTV